MFSKYSYNLILLTLVESWLTLVQVNKINKTGCKIGQLFKQQRILYLNITNIY